MLPGRRGLTLGPEGVSAVDQTLRLRRSLRQAGLMAACAGAAVLIPAATAVLPAQEGALAATPSAAATATPASGAQTGGPAVPAAVSGPQLTAVGYSVLALPAATAAGGAAQPASVNVDLSVTNRRASVALAQLQAAAASLRNEATRVGVPAADIATQGPPSVNLNVGADSYQAGMAVALDVRSLTAAAALIDRLRLGSDPAVGNVWIDTPSQAGAPGAQALSAAYTSALAQAHASALVLAAADHLTLGAQLAVTEGAPAAAPPCAAGSGCTDLIAPGVPEPPLVGPDQQLIAVTVTYATSPDRAS
jgi:hypothetical protein